MPETDLRAAFIAGLRELANHFEATPDLPLPFEVVHQDPAIGTFTFHAQSAEEYAAAVRALGGRREKGTGGTGGRLAATTRTFGPGVVFRVFVPRGEVCERRVVDSVTKVEGAVACVSCGRPIAPHPKDPASWFHVTVEDVPLQCDAAVAPDFTEVSTTTTEVVEWDCKPVLGTEAADR
jgi:hypothetical protein